MLATLLSEVTWPDVAIALIAIIPTTLAALFAYLAAIRAEEVKRELATTTGTTLAEQVEHILEVALANHYGIRRINGESNVDSGAGLAGVTPPHAPDPDFRREPPRRGRKKH